MPKQGWERDLAAGLYTAILAGVLQAGPIYIPGVGYLLAALASLPVARLALHRPGVAGWSALAAALLVRSIHLQEAIIFTLTTAPLGLLTGWSVGHGLRPARATLVVALPLLSGMVALQRVAGVAPLGPWLAHLNAAAAGMALACFSVAYSYVWVSLLAGYAGRVMGWPRGE